jgi:hypothetical protein
MTDPAWLRIAYGANILILLTVCAGMFAGPVGGQGVFQGQVPESAGLRLLVGSLWAAILLASIAGLRWPGFFAPVVLIQIVYKALWLAAFVAPLLLSGRADAVPWGIATVFAAIVLVYPLLFWRAL